MAMSRRDYEAVARVVKNSAATAEGETLDRLETLARALGVEFNSTNAGFSQSKFMQACGFKSE